MSTFINVLRSVATVPEAELGHQLFSSPCFGQSQQQLLPSIIPGVLFLSPSLFVSSSLFLAFLLFARSGFLWATVTVCHGYKRSVQVLVKGFARMSRITFSTLLMWCGEQATTNKLMWNVLVLICFILQLSYCLELKFGITEKINDPTGWRANALLTFLIVFICSVLRYHPITVDLCSVYAVNTKA